MMDDDCTQCGHPFNPHRLVALFESAMDGGIILCDEPHCDCVATWSPAGTPRPEMPPVHVIDQIRAEIHDHG